MTDLGDLLLVSTRQEGDRAVVELEGEFDLHTAPIFAAAVEHLLDVGTIDIEVDAGAVAFADSAGLRALLNAQRDAVELGGGLRLTRLSAALDRMLGMTGLHGHFGADPMTGASER